MHVREPSRRRVATLAIVWGALFAAAHFYWALGGRAGMDDEPATTTAEAVYIGAVGAIGLLSAAVAHAFLRPPGARRALPRPTLLARTGAVMLLLGVGVGTGRWIADGSLGDDGAIGVAITAYFLLGGILFGLLGWRRHGPFGDARPAHAAPAGRDP